MGHEEQYVFWMHAWECSVAHSCVSRMPSLSKVLALPRMIVAGPIAWCLLGFLRFTALPRAGSVMTMTGFAPYHTCDTTNESSALQFQSDKLTPGLPVPCAGRAVAGTSW